MIFFLLTKGKEVDFKILWKSLLQYCLKRKKKVGFAIYYEICAVLLN
jgi:hypothetical protein